MSAGGQELKKAVLLQAFAKLLSHVAYDISSSHGGEYEVQNCLLGCTAV
jgi:hypothetical protein